MQADARPADPADHLRGDTGTLYHRWTGWHAPYPSGAIIVAGRRSCAPAYVRWGFAVIEFWDAAALGFLIIIWPIILRPMKSSWRDPGAPSYQQPASCARCGAAEGSASRRSA